MQKTKEDIRNLSYDELVQYFVSIGEKSYRATQVFEWIYKKGILSFDKMKSLSNDLRDRLAKEFTLSALDIEKKQISKDGTTKFLFNLKDNETIEAVLIPTKTRTTVCVSSQSGCKFGCRFCASGIGGWKRNLSVAEILAQVLCVREESLKHKKILSHIVFMGIGEPFDNYDNVLKAIRIINDKKGLNIGVRKITVSTCGVIPKIKKFAKEKIQIELAISLHGFDNDSRNILMPVNRKYPFDELMETCREYIKETNRQITFEYILIRDVTCTDKAAKSLKKAFKGLICKMNLIPYNPIEDFDYKSPLGSEIALFKDQLAKCGIHATVRAPRGRDISGACGQLRHSVK